MSGRAEATRTPVRPPTHRLFTGCAAALVCVLVAALSGWAQPPDDVEDRQLLPADMPKRVPPAAKYLYPDKDRLIFKGSRDKNGVQVGGIRDDEELATEKTNGDEYRALIEVVLFLTDPAKGFTPAELEEHAATDLTREALTYPSRERFRLDLLRFDGTVTKIRRLEPWKEMVAGGVKELFEGVMVPADEPPSRTIRFLFTQLPPGITAPTSGEWVPVEKWAQFAGYSFKCLLYPGPNADPKNKRAGGWERAPLLIGLSFTPATQPPPSIQVNHELWIFRRIIDDAPSARGGDNWEEAESWNRVVLHARKFTPEQLHEAADKERTFADLFRNSAEYKLDIVHFEGRLIRLRSIKVAEHPRLVEAGLDTLYEAWIIPANEPSGNPICVVISELPAGLEPQQAGKGLMNKWVSFDGYYFKLMRYESGDKDANDVNKWKRAPLLIGRSITLLEDPGVSSIERWKQFVPWIVVGLLLLVGTAIALSWWFRRGDRRAKEEIDNLRNKNPFEGNG